MLPSPQAPRERALRDGLSRLVAVLHADAAAEPGSQPWLELEVRWMLEAPAAEGARHEGDSDEAVFPTLRGTSASMAARQWSQEDTAWAQGHHDLPEFHLETSGFSVLDIGATSLRWWGRDRVPDAAAVARELLARREFRAVSALLDQAHSAATPSSAGAAESFDASVENALRSLLREGFEPEKRAIAKRLAGLVDRFGAPAVAEAPSGPEVDAALVAYDADAALDWCDLIEAELAAEEQAAELRGSDPAAAEQRAHLVRLLLLAGAAGVDEGAPLRELAARWDDEYRRRENEREHLAAVESALARVGHLVNGRFEAVLFEKARAPSTREGGRGRRPAGAWRALHVVGAEVADALGQGLPVWTWSSSSRDHEERRCRQTASIGGQSP